MEYKVCHHNPISFASIKKKSPMHTYSRDASFSWEPSQRFLNGLTASLIEIQLTSAKATRYGSHIEYPPQPILVAGGSIDQLRDLQKEVSAPASSAEMLHGTKRLLKSVFVVWLDCVDHHNCVRLGRHGYLIMKRKMVEGKLRGYIPLEYGTINGSINYPMAGEQGWNRCLVTRNIAAPSQEVLRDSVEEQVFIAR